MADFLAKEQLKIEQLAETFANTSSTNQSNTSNLGRLTFVDSLWLAVFQELWARADNPRAEIRNCALQTLYSTLTTYGQSCLTLASWQQLAEQILLPSLAWVVKRTQRADRKTAINNAAHMSPGNLAARDPHPPVLLVHHSRNTEAKQWHETQVIVLTGTIRVFKMFFDTFTRLGELYETSWQTLLHNIEIFSQSDSAEVSVVRISTFLS